MEIRGAQDWIPGSLDGATSREECRAAKRQLGIGRFERECRTVDVNGRKLKAWRVPGEAEYAEHERRIRLLASIYSRAKF